MEKMPDKPILIVDDAKNNRILLKAMLSRKGYQVEECEDGIECLEFCVDNPPALVLLDIMMPRMDGITACQTLRECYNKAELPVILCTAKSESSDIAAGLSAGANDYVVKPIDMIVLMARIESQLKFAETTQELEDQKAKA